MEEVTKRVTKDQKFMLIQYLEEHREFAHDRFINSTGVKSLTEEWDALAEKLNALGGVLKNGENWERAWINMRSKAKQKYQEYKNSLERSGINGAQKYKLTELDERIVGIMAKESVVGQAEVNVAIFKYVPILSAVDDLIVDKWSALIYFYGPNLFILLINFVTFAHLTSRIYKVRRNLAKITRKEKFFQENAIVILRLFLIMGISWLFDILSYCMRRNPDYDFLFVLSDFGNAIQGLLIFSLFVLKRNVLNILKKRFQRQEISQPRRSVSSSNTVISKLLTSQSVPNPVTPISSDIW